MQKEVLRVLLDTLMEKELIAKSTYDGAVNLVNSHMDFPEFFWYPVCCHKRPQAQCKRATERSEALGESYKEENDNGCSQDPK